MYDEYDDASTVLDTSRSLGSFLDTQIAKAKEIEHAENFDMMFSSHEQSPEHPDSKSGKSNYLDDTYITLDDEFFKDYMSHETTLDPETFKKLLEKHFMKTKLLKLKKLNKLNFLKECCLHLSNHLNNLSLIMIRVTIQMTVMLQLMMNSVKNI